MKIFYTNLYFILFILLSQFIYNRLTQFIDERQNEDPLYRPSDENPFTRGNGKRLGCHIS